MATRGREALVRSRRWDVYYCYQSICGKSRCFPASRSSSSVTPIVQRSLRFALVTLPLLTTVACRATPGTALPSDPRCAAALQRTDLQALLRALDTVASLAPVWDGYSIRRHPVLLVARDTMPTRADSGSCIVLWRHAGPAVTLRASAEPRYSTPLYGFFNGDSLGPRARAGSQEALGGMRRVPADLFDPLRRLAVRRAVLLPVPPDLRRLGPVGTEIAKQPGRLTGIQADLAIHEGFHLHVQFPRWFDQPSDHPWPGWDIQPDRAALVARCYAAASDSLALRAEHDALVSAFRALWVDSGGADTARAKRHLGAYVEARRARYARAARTRIAAGADSVSCPVAEDVMELQEGATQWIGHSTSVRAGLNTTAGLDRSYANAQRERFYQTGAMQLWVLEAMRGRSGVRRITAAISRSRGPGRDGGGSIFGYTMEVAEGR